jgi:hypothetical protein
VGCLAPHALYLLGDKYSLCRSFARKPYAAIIAIQAG